MGKLCFFVTVFPQITHYLITTQKKASRTNQQIVFFLTELLYGNEVYPTPWEWLLLLWLSALFVTKIQEAETNTLRLLIMLLSTASIGVNVYALFTDGKTREHLMYARDNILAFVLLILIMQILEFLTMHELFGPWSIIIKNLVFDVVRFLCVLLLFIGGFTMHMCVIYKPVYNKARTYIPTDVTSFGTKGDFLSIFYELFFALFGLSDRPGKILEADEVYYPAITYQIATLVFAMYEIITIIVLVNLLIAMMSSTYTRIEERSEIEWKFGRATVIRHMTRSGSVPPPMNIITAVVSIVKFVGKVKCMCGKSTIIFGVKENEVSSDNMESEDEEEITEKGILLLYNVVPWKSIIRDYWESKGVEVCEQS